jgi:hypothetical protein
MRPAYGFCVHLSREMSARLGANLANRAQLIANWRLTEILKVAGLAAK